MFAEALEGWPLAAVIIAGIAGVVTAWYILWKYGVP